MHTPIRDGFRWAFALALLALALLMPGCARNQTTLDDRTLEQKPHTETDKPTDRSDPFRP
ncbi:MAG: hypothetical protein M5U26_02365 [Planctomycetota bacterium]|nr:hypothetical protein [Planctomycetota bacterium]